VGISSGWNYACSVLSGGKVACWGYNNNGQLGIGHPRTKFVPVTVPLIREARGVSAGFDNTCALLAGGKIACWGSNWHGKLGNGTTKRSTRATLVKRIRAATQVSVGSGGGCAIVSGGRVMCWGENRDGELGNGTRNSSAIPVQVTGIRNAIAISVSGLGACVVTLGGAVKCWGVVAAGPGSVFYLSTRLTAVKLKGVSHATAVSVNDVNGCVIVKPGRVKCWGYNDAGQLGNGRVNISSYARKPTFVLGIKNAVSITTGDGHACATILGGAVECWGDNRFGELGDGSQGHKKPDLGFGWDSDFSVLPVKVSGLTSAVQVSACLFQTCAVLAGGGAECWGADDSGQLGDGAELVLTKPVGVIGLS
jgi:alpha-tubulin suppressor-like RCC1 family protein